MGCLGGMSTIRYTRLVFTRAFRGKFSLKFPQNKIVMAKKDRCTLFGCHNDRLLPLNSTVKDHTSFFGVSTIVIVSFVIYNRYLTSSSSS